MEMRYAAWLCLCVVWSWVNGSTHVLQIALSAQFTTIGGQKKWGEILFSLQAFACGLRGRAASSFWILHFADPHAFRPPAAGRHPRVRPGPRRTALGHRPGHRPWPGRVPHPRRPAHRPRRRARQPLRTPARPAAPRPRPAPTWTASARPAFGFASAAFHALMPGDTASKCPAHCAWHFWRLRGHYPTQGQGVLSPDGSRPDRGAGAGFGLPLGLVRQGRTGSTSNGRRSCCPAPIVEYVVVHEMSHLHEPHHTPAFWRRVERAMPDHERQRGWLGSHGMEVEGL